jgi:hypothetical protein
MFGDKIVPKPDNRAAPEHLSTTVQLYQDGVEASVMTLVDASRFYATI